VEKEIILSKKAPAAIETSGHIPIDLKTGEMVEGDIEAQSEWH